MNTDTYLWHNGQTKEDIINVINDKLTPEQVTKNIESRKSHLLDIVQLVGKDGALHLIEHDKTQMFVPGLSAYEHTQMVTGGFDQEEFVKSLPFGD